jgi:hypothetical protein
VNRRAVGLAEMLSQFHLAVNGAVPPDKPSRETYNDERWLRRAYRTRGRPVRRQYRTFGLETGCIGGRRCSGAGIARKNLASTRTRSRDDKEKSSKNNRSCHERTSRLISTYRTGENPHERSGLGGKLLRWPVCFASARRILWQIRHVRYAT